MLKQLKHKMDCTSTSNVFVRTFTHWVLLFLCSYITVAVNANDGYLVTHPMKFRPGTDERLSVTIFEPLEDIKVQARLLWKEEVIADTEKFIFGKGFLTLQVPRHIYGRATVEICGNCELGASGFHFKNSSMVDITDKSSSVFIQIDKPVYKPGQEVLINFILTGPDLRPKDEKVVAYIMDPHGSRMIHWKRLKPLCCGIMNVTFPLSDQPVLGEWTIFAEIGTQLFNKTFEIKKYVLPRFEVFINPPSYITNFSTCATATVTARYTYGKPVEGKLSINMNLHGLGYYDTYVGQNKYMFMDISGTASFDICINTLLSAKLKPYFRGVVHIEASVTSNDGNAFTASDDSCRVNKLLARLEFAKDLRQHYKPGLPYYGKVNVLYPDNSPADDITVRISAEVNEETIYSYDYISSGGAVEFDIPTLPVGSGLVWLNAKIIAINGEDVTDTYESSLYQHLSSWYSPSHCHILVKNLNPGLKVGDTAMVGVLSTCPCNFTYHYEVMSRGNIVKSGTHKAFQSFIRNKRNLDPEVQLIDDVIHKNATIPAPIEHCETVFTFEVTHGMAPMSRLLVYYVLDNDEGVADSMTLDVEPRFENQVKVRLSRNETRPDHKLSMVVSAKPGSCLCFVAVDRSVQLLKPNYQINLKNVFEELGEYDISAGMHEDTYWWQGGFNKRRRRSSPLFRSQRSRDAQFAFREAGLKVMTDKVHLVFPVQDLSIKGGHWMEQEGPGSNQIADYRVDRHRRAYFPETWIWQCFNLSETRKEEHIHIHAPDTITTWSIDFIGLSKTHGLGVAQTAVLKTFKDFFVEMTLPYSVIRGEQLRVPVTIYNYMDFCVQLSLVVHLSEGVQFIGETGRRHDKKLCVEAGEVMTTHVVLVFGELGNKKIHAGAEAFNSPNCCEGPISEESVVAVDKVTQNILVEAEGIPRGYAYSVFFCPNERVHISTPNKYEYQFVKKPASMEYLTFLVKAKNDATIGLARNHDAHELYEIVLGGWDNSMSWIARSRMGDQVVMEPTQDIVSWHEFRAFWITWDDGEITVGHGEIPTNDSVILSWVDDEPLLPVEYVGFSTGMGSIGEFRIWRKEEDDEAYSEAFTLTLPLNFVPGSERAVATIIGDVMGPTLNNLHNLIRLPFGCGEQNMIHFAPIVYVMDYLKRTRQLTPETEAEAKTFLVQGYQRQLTYKRYDGSYSAFGENDLSGSMWLTAFVLKSFAQSRAFIYIDPRELEESKAWIVSQQEVDGSFPPIGRIMNKDIQGGVQGKVSLTAYVLVALLESGLETMEEERAVTIAQQFLEYHIESVSDPYTAALVAYALTVQSSIFAPFAVRILSNLAIRKEGLTYWRLSGEPLETLPFWMADAHAQPKLAVSSAEVEMTAYALLTYTAMGDIAYSLPIVKWLTQQRNSLGGFSSTQDTCVALQALSEYATLAYVGHVKLNISLAYSDMTSLVEEYYSLNDENSQVLQVIEIPVLSKTIFLGAYGEGCGLMQIDVDYNIPDPSTKPSFKLNVNLIEEDFPGRRRRAVNPSGEISNVIPTNEDYVVEIEVCTRWLHAGSSNMAVVEVSLLSGFSAGIESLERVLLDNHSKVKRYEFKGRKVILYFDEIPSQCMTCVRFNAYREHAVGKLSSVPVKVYDYYEPHFEAIKFYNVSRDSPLSGELCEEDRECNLVEDQAPEPPAVQPQPDPNLEEHFLNPNIEQCNSLDGDCITPADLKECVCERTCLYGGSRVCGSDGVIYENYCTLEVAACQMNTNIRTMPINYCPEPEVTTIEVPPEEESSDGSGSQWPDWPIWPQSTIESIPDITPTLEPTKSTPKPGELPVNPEQPELPGLPFGPMTWPPFPESVVAEEAVDNVEMNANETNTEELTKGEHEIVETPEGTETVENGQQENLPRLNLPSTSSPFVEENKNIEPVKSIENGTKSSVNTGSVLNVNTTPQTVIGHKQEPNQEILPDTEPKQDILPDTSRTDLEELIALVATNGTLIPNMEEHSNVQGANQNEKVISVKAKAWPNAKHVHGKLANEVVNHDDETPTETVLDQVTRLHDHVTDVKESKNEVIRNEKVNSSRSELPKPSSKTEQILPGKLTGISPVKPTEHLGLDNHPNVSTNQSQEQDTGNDENAQELEAKSQESDRKTEQDQNLTEQPDLQEKETGHKMISSGPSEKPLVEAEIPVTVTIIKDDDQQELGKRNNTHIVVEQNQGTAAPTKATLKSKPTEEVQREEGAVITTESPKTLGGNTVEPSTTLQHENSKTQEPTQTTKTTTSQANIAHELELKGTEAPNQNEEEFKPANQMPGQENVAAKSSLVQSELVNQTMEEVQNGSIVSAQDPFKSEPTGVPKPKFEPSISPSSNIKEDNVTENNSTVKSTRLEVVDLEDNKENINDTAQNSNNLLNSPNTNLDTMINDQGVAVDNVEDTIIDKDTEFVKEGSQER